MARKQKTLPHQSSTDAVAAPAARSGTKKIRTKKQGTYLLSAEAALAQRSWKIIDAAGVNVGRLASRVAALLRGKHRVTFTPHTDGGDYVIVINAAKVAFTGAKWENKIYHTYSGYVGGHKERAARDVMRKNPEEIIRRAVQGMLPSGPLARATIKKLKIYVDEIHPHAAQEPVECKVSNR